MSQDAMTFLYTSDAADAACAVSQVWNWLGPG